MSHRWRNGYRIAYLDKVEPEIFALRMESLKERTGEQITSAAVVQEARPDGSDIHGLFEWDDSVAADEYRLCQARNALNSLRVVRITDGQQTEERIAYVHIKEPEEGRHVYVSSEIVAQRVDYQDQAVEEALRYLKGFQRRYKHLRALEPLIDAVEQAMDNYAPQAAKAAV
jgi:hypothetical protein